MSYFKRQLPLFLALVSLAVGAIPTLAQTPRERTVNFKETKQSKLAPIVRIVSPVGDGLIAPGKGRVGAGTLNGAGFLVGIEAVTRDQVPVTAKEALNVRDTSLLGKPNPNFPGLSVSFDTDLIKPDGGIIPKDTNLASLFNVVGTDDTPGPGVTIWAGWHVLESLPPNVNKFTITAVVVDDAGRRAVDRVTLDVQRNGITSGQALTPKPSNISTTSQDHPNGPDLTVIAPRVPTRISPGPKGTPVMPNGSLFFLQVSALDRARAGIGVHEGVILDQGQIPNPNGPNPSGGPNRKFPGLNVTFDVPLRQPNGNLIPAGANLAPLFNIAGSEIDGDGLVRTTAHWVVGGSLELPPGKNVVTITTRVTDNAGHTSSIRQIVGISPVRNGQDLTPHPYTLRPQHRTNY